MNKFIVGIAVFCFLSSALAGPKGTVPRSAATRYPLHAERDGLSIGAVLLNRKEARKTFQKNVQSDRDVAVYPTTSIGYSSGSVYDPVTGTRQGGGVYTQAGVGVAIGSPHGPGVSDKDRSVMETELAEKGLPEGAAPSPVAGYVYFPVLSKKKADYQVEYVFDGKKLVLPVHVE